MNKMISVKFTRGRHGRKDRYYPDSPFAEMLCTLILRSDEKTAACLTEWQVAILRKNGFEVEIEEVN